MNSTNTGNGSERDERIDRNQQQIDEVKDSLAKAVEKIVAREERRSDQLLNRSENLVNNVSLINLNYDVK